MTGIALSHIQVIIGYRPEHEVDPIKAGMHPPHFSPDLI